MQFRKKYDFRNKENRKLIAQATWRPNARDYKDIIEDYLQISRIRRNNKLAILKLQLHLLEDLITHQKIVDNLHEQLIARPWNKKHIKQEIFVQELILKNLKDLADGIAFRYFDYDRALLYYLGENPPRGPIKPHPGMIVELEVWSEAFDYGQAKALMNDITNYIRIGDITVFHDNGVIEFIEVKSGKSMRGRKRRARLLRQQNKLEETIKFFNTGITEVDGQELSIKKIPLKPKYYFDSVSKLIQETKDRGASYSLIEDYLLVECVDFKNKKSAEEITGYFKENTKPIIEKWIKNGDYIFGPVFFHERLDFSHNLTPISIWPFDSSTCADLMMGRLMMTIEANISQIQRKFESEGWKVKKSVLDMKKEEKEINKLTSLMTIEKNGFVVEVPPGILGRSIFEFLSLSTLIETFVWEHQNTPVDQGGLVLISYENEKENWD